MKQLLILMTVLSFGNGFAQAQSYFGARVPDNFYVSNDKKELTIPNAFSPNNDGQNDYFKIWGITNEQVLEFKVFNRWGTILYNESNSTTGWDGTHKGVAQPLGVYGYVIRIKFPNGNIEIYRGTVTLVR